jgi:hypothetical protein
VPLRAKARFAGVRSFYSVQLVAMLVMLVRIVFWS